MSAPHTHSDGAAHPARAEPAPRPGGVPPGPAVPRDSSPTWELELLISGAVLFGLFQIPAALDDLFARLAAQLTSGAAIGLFYGYLYAKATVYILVAAFVVHLVSRAYWVGLVGLESVFPGGIRWDALSYGPVSREVWRDQLPPLRRTIARVDNFSSVIFAFAFGVVLLFALSVLAVLVAGAVAYVGGLLLGGRHHRQIFFATLALLAVPSMVLALVDRWGGARMDPAGARGMALRRAIRVVSRLTFVRLWAPILFTLMSNVRKAIIQPLLFVAFLGTIVTIGVELLARRGAITMGGADYFSDESHVNAIDSRYYESQWPAGYVEHRFPSIQSDVVRDPYVRLFVPYWPERHTAAMGTRCPEARPLERAGPRLARHEHRPEVDSAAAAALRCLAALHQVTVNGEPRPDVAFRFYRHPRTELRGLLAYIPTAGLPRGENVLTVLPPPPAPGRRRRQPLEPHVVRFWL